MEEDLRRALESEDEGTDGLENTEGGNALIVRENSILIRASLLNNLTDDPEVGVTELLGELNGEGSELGSKDFDEFLHDVGKLVELYLVGELKKLLHDGGNVGLHGSLDSLVADESLESERSFDTDGKLGVGKAAEDVVVDDHHVLFSLDIDSTLL